MRFVRFLVVCALFGGGNSAPAEETPFLTLASTTSTRDSGLFAAILPEFQAATDAALALQAVLSARGVVPPKDQQLVISCEEREKQAEREHEEFVARELALYRASVQRDGERAQVLQLRRVLRAINHDCDLEFLRLKLILEECFEALFQEPIADCPASR